MEFQSYDELFPGRFLKAGLFNGQPVTYTIADIKREELESDRGTEPKIIMAFHETPLQLVLAKVNAEAIKAMFGPSVPGWIGKRITLYGTTSIMPYPKRKDEPCIRVYGSPDITEVVRCEWTPPRRKPVVQILQPVASPTLTKALEAIAAAGSDEQRQAIIARARTRHNEGQLTDRELQVIIQAAGPAPQAPEPDSAPEPEPGRAPEPEPVCELPAAAPEASSQPPSDEALSDLAAKLKAHYRGREVLLAFMEERSLGPRTPISKAVATQADLDALLTALQ